MIAVARVTCLRSVSAAVTLAMTAASRGTGGTGRVPARAAMRTAVGGGAGRSAGAVTMRGFHYGPYSPEARACTDSEMDFCIRPSPAVISAVQKGPMMSSGQSMLAMGIGMPSRPAQRRDLHMGV